MAAKMDELDTIWEIDDDLWTIVMPILDDYWPRKATRRRPADWRQCLNGIIYRLRSGCQWNKLPKQFGDDATVHGWFQRWSGDGVLENIWAVLVEHSDELGDVEWKWQAAESTRGKSRFGGRMSPQTRQIGRKTARRRTCWSMARAARSPR